MKEITQSYVVVSSLIKQHQTRAIPGCLSRSEENEDLLDVTFDVLDFLTDDVEADGLGEGSALANSHDITGSDTESGGAMARHGLVALFESVVLLDEVEVVTTDDNGVLHLVGDDDAPKGRKLVVWGLISLGGGRC